MITIDTNVPMPDDFRRKYPFSSMEVGDSFFIEGDAKALRNVRSAMFHYARPFAALMFKARQVEEEGVVGVRCWRVS